MVPEIGLERGTLTLSRAVYLGWYSLPKDGCQSLSQGLDSHANGGSIMIDPWLVVAIALIVMGVTGGIKVTIGNINIANKTKEKDDN